MLFRNHEELDSTHGDRTQPRGRLTRCLRPISILPARIQGVLNGSHDFAEVLGRSRGTTCRSPTSCPSLFCLDIDHGDDPNANQTGAAFTQSTTRFSIRDSVRGQNEATEATIALATSNPIPSITLDCRQHGPDPNEILLASSSTPSDPSQTSTLLSQVRRYIDCVAEYAATDRKPCIMDVILDLKASAAAERRTSSKAVVRAHRSETPDMWSRYREYDFSDTNSLDAYWADQSSIWRGTHINCVFKSGSIHYPDSCERSTASWPSILDFDRRGSTKR
ncbi:hypothetical protein AMATHDRAFT_47190 [Amanita thiersii Skay4041]|uniref:Uncharacterized protein n=1 Tax=Amanita thiersii Skay4041 TaxID=703135 RepID=A0A2A9NUF2_9AGAR|nr:hypothetical protein AMATHDRAFT_47190 [Amanita thiersii Skay4041]